MIIAIEGIDGSGKHTQAVLLNETLPNSYLVDFPRYKSRSSELVKMYLGGEISDDPFKVNPYLASLFYACDRGISYNIDDWGKKYQNGDIIIMDRYTYSNYIHQMHKLPKTEWRKFIKYIQELEYEKLGLPKPDITIFLSVPFFVSIEQMNKRYENDELKKDIHEKNAVYLRKCIEASEFCIEELGWISIDVTNVDESGEFYVKSKNDIHQLIMNTLKERKII